MGEDATDADTTAFAQLLHLPEVNFYLPQRMRCFCVGVVVVAVVVATARCRWVAPSTESNPN